MARGSIVIRHGKYSIKFYANGKQYWKTIGSSRAAAESALVQAVAKSGHGQGVELKKIAFEAFCDLWLREYGTIRLKPSTVRSHRSILAHLVAGFGKTPLRRISTFEIDRYIAAALRDQRMSKATAGNHLSLLRALCNQAIAWGYLENNPCDRVERVRTDPKPPQYLTPDEFRRLVSHARAPFDVLFLVAGLTGLRKSEILALRWEDIDWTHRLLRVQWSLDKGQRVSPKSRSSKRSIVATRAVMGALAMLRASKDIGTGAGPVFREQMAGALSPRKANYELEIARRAGKVRKIRFHDLRHTYASFLLATGANIKFIQHQMGHSSIRITLDIYGHLLTPGTGSDELDRFVGLEMGEI